MTDKEEETPNKDGPGRRLTESVFSGVRWTATGQVARQAANTVISIILARLLAPEDYGLVAMANVFVGFLTVFQSLGTNFAIIQRKKLSQELLSSCLILNLGLGVGMSALVFGAAPWVGSLMSDGRVVRVLQVLGITFAITAAGLVHGALLNRELMFDRIIKAELLSVVVDGGTAIVLAYEGWKVWALVVGTIVGAAVRTVLLIVASRWMPRLAFRWTEMKEIARFSLNLTIFNIVNYFERNADYFIIGRALGAVSLGYYSMGWKLYQRPLEGLTGVMTRVMYPALSRLQEDKPRIRELFLRANGGIAFLAFPMMIGLAVVAKPFVLGVLGGKWEPAIPVVQILALVGIMQAIAVTTNQLYLAMGRSDLRLWWGVSAGLIVVLAFLCGIPWGILGVVSAYAIIMVPLTYLCFFFSFKMVDLRLVDLLNALRPYFLGSLAMGTGATAVRLLLEAAGVRPVLILAGCVPLGALIYAACMLGMKPPALRDMVSLVPERLRPRGIARLVLADGAAAATGMTD